MKTLLLISGILYFPAWIIIFGYWTARFTREKPDYELPCSMLLIFGGAVAGLISALCLLALCLSFK